MFQWEQCVSIVFVKSIVLDKYFDKFSAFFHFSLTLGFSLSIALFAFEMMTFLAGITMFIASVSLLCIFFMRISFVRSSHQSCFIKNAVLKNIFSIHRKIPVLESLFDKGLHACNFIKKRIQQLFSCEYCEIFKNTYFEKHLRTAASVF